MTQKEVVLTGLRTNAEYHIGNYLGAILPTIDRAKNFAGKYQINMFAPDLHSFTTPIDHSKLYSQTMRNLKIYAASGLPIDHEDIFVYRQSYIPAHSELTIILNNFVYFGELSRMIQFKEKSGIINGSDDKSSNNSVTSGLFTYPVLMAADILLYDAKWVPVGDDQTQHLEFTRDLAERFNHKFGNIFVVPEPVSQQHEFVGKTQATRIRSLRNPEFKMSKSVTDPAGTIQLSDMPEEAAKKVMGATTDSIGKINFDWQNQPGISNLLQMLGLLTNRSLEGIIEEWQGQSNYGDLKKAVAEAVKTTLERIQNNFIEVDDKVLEAKLVDSESKLRQVANAQLLKVQKAVGLRP